MQQLCGSIGIAVATRQENLAMFPIINASSARKRELDAQITLDPVVNRPNEVHEKGSVGVFVKA